MLTAGELDVTNIAHGGFGVARLDGRVVFVSEAIPGERVRRARHPTTARRSFWWADTVEVLEASPHRRPHLVGRGAVSRPRPPTVRAAPSSGTSSPRHQRALQGARYSPMPLSSAWPHRARRRRGGRRAAPPTDGLDGAPASALHVAEDGTVGPYAARSHTRHQGGRPPARHRRAAGGRADRRADARLRRSRVRGARARSVGRRAPGRPATQKRPASSASGSAIASSALDDAGFWQVHRGGGRYADARRAGRRDRRRALDPDGREPRPLRRRRAAGRGDRRQVRPATRITTCRVRSARPPSTRREPGRLARRAGRDRAGGALGARPRRRIRARGGRGWRRRPSCSTRRASGAGREVLEALTASAPRSSSTSPATRWRSRAMSGLLAGLGYRAGPDCARSTSSRSTHHVEAVGAFVRA